jgi:hypothetical protein|tara:strand:+ start:2924 stop:3559 length:636 start_codon:yes stop_codon:yes gene_type:complete
MNYAELTASIQTYTENTETDFVAEIPTFVKQTEDRIQHIVQLPLFRKTSTTQLVADDRFLKVPSDFIAPYSLAVLDASSNYSYLLNKDVDFIREAYDQTTTTGQPRFYAMWDEDTFILGPTPNAALTIQLNFFYKPNSIVDTSTTWLGDEAPAALLYGCLVEAYTFMKGEADLITAYDTRFKEALVKLKELGDGKTRQDMYRSGQIRVPVQ